MEQPIPEDVVALLRDRVTSLEQLEVVLRLRAESATHWRVEDMADRVGLPPDVTEAALLALSVAELVAFVREGDEPRWFYRPATAALDEQLERLAEWHRARPLELMRLLNAQAMDRIRNSAARAFSEAFVIGRKKDG